jgi:hypothetical protein
MLLVKVSQMTGLFWNYHANKRAMIEAIEMEPSRAGVHWHVSW